MSQPKVLALLAKRKFRETMGPRKPQPEVFDNAEQPVWALLKPRYQVGDMLYVKETWQKIGNYPICYMAGQSGCGSCFTHIWKPSIFMPKKYARIWMTCTKVTVQRPQELSARDLWTEGLQFGTGAVYQGQFQWKELYISIYGKEIWEQNLLHFVYWWDEIIIKGETQRQFEKNISAGVSKMKKKPKKHPAAKALETWFESEEGLRCLEGNTSGQYLKNRLWWAFMAGWKAAKAKHKKKIKMPSRMD